MATFPFMQVDAFTDRALGGNPCAIVFDADALDEATMQAIAREMNLSETAFVLQSAVADVRARYFTPAEEVPLAGHPTIATMHALVETGRLALTGEKTTFSLELQVGPIQVDVYAEAGSPQRIVMSQMKPQFLAIYGAEEIMPVFGLAAEDALPGAPIQTVSTGTPHLLIPVRDHAALRRIEMNHAAYRALRAAGDFAYPHAIALGGVTAAGDTFARQFGTLPDVVEDSFTGSATGCMGAYLWHYGLIPAPTFVAEQGHWMGRPGQTTVEVVGPPDDIQTVRVGGTAVTVVRGELML